MECFLLSAACKLQYSWGYCQLSPVNLPLPVMLSDYGKWVKCVPIGRQTRHEGILENIKKKKSGSKWLPLYREILYYSLISKSIPRSVLVYVTKADCKGHTCSVRSMNRNILIFNTHVLTLKSELPANSYCVCYVLTCILDQMWMDLAGLAGEVGTSFSWTLSLPSKRASASFSDTKEAEKR